MSIANEIQQLYIGYLGRAADQDGLDYWVNNVTNHGWTIDQVALSFADQPEYAAIYGADPDRTQLVSLTYNQLFERDFDLLGLEYWVNGAGASVPDNLLVKTFLEAASAADRLVVANKTQVANYYTAEKGSAAEYEHDAAHDSIDDVDGTQASVDAAIAAIDAGEVKAPGTNFAIQHDMVGAADAMHLTGDQDIRIDFTNPANQIKGLDLNGDGIIANDGVENHVTGVAANYEIVDAYARNPLNERSVTQNFLGDIAFDGTGFGGDGVTTDGNIVLGGLGVDAIYGGIGNDFLTGGGIAADRVAAARAAWIAAGGTAANFVAPADFLSGGRNADFFFAELSALDATDGNRVNIDGGTTADDSAAGIVQTAQDADWLLFEASDDDEPVTINLRDESTGDGTASEWTGSIVNRSGVTISNLRDIENFDASGNLYGFLDNMDVEIGGRRTDDRVEQNGTLNNGIGTSAQLNISGSKVANIIVGGYDNDHIEGNDGNDLLMGGNLHYLINPNMATIVNDGRDELFGGLGDDDIVFEADGGIIEGDTLQNIIGFGNDTLWLTDLALGKQTAADMTTDGVLRFDLDAQNISLAAGYGGADVGTRDFQPNDTQDQTNYKTGIARTTVQDMENVIATGLGAIDYDTDGSNSGDIGHLSQVNQAAYMGNLTLRGTAGVNILYASNGDDVLEGRAGGTITFNNAGQVIADDRDKLSGGEGDDDFVFYLQNNTGDGVDVIHRQADLDKDGFWDGYGTIANADGVIVPRVGNFVQDFGEVSDPILANSKLTLTLIDNSHPADLSGFPVDGVVFTLNGVSYTVSLPADKIQSSYADFVAGLNAALDENPVLKPLNAELNADNTITITDPAGHTFAAGGYTFVGDIVPPAGILAWDQTVGGASSTQTEDRLIYRAYEDRFDGELVDDDAVTGSTISLGRDAYAEDLVINFSSDGTRIAEDQSYQITFNNLTTQDKVTINVNGVTYSLQVGVDLDGNSIAAEDGVGDSQFAIQAAFLTRLNAFINSFMDNDTASGQVVSNFAGSTLTLTQQAYNGEETVFMTTPIVTLENLSNGEVATARVTNTSQHEVHLLDYDGRNLDGTGTNLDETNVRFVGDTDTNRSILKTADNLLGGVITGTDAVLVDGGADDLAGITNNTATNANLPLNFSVHGDDFILGGAAVDTINAGTGDDRVQGSKGNDILDGGKNYYSVQVLGEAEARVVTWNVWEAANPTSAQSLLADPTLAGKVITNITLINQTEGGETPVANSGLFDDTLIYSQSDFTTGATRFTVILDNYTVTGGVVNLNNGGAGKVAVDIDGNGTFESTSTFTNFENVRTVSGTGRAVAGVGGGQGNDTLDVAALSTSTGGIEYDLTNRADAANPVGAGKVSYSVNAHANAGGIARPVEADFESLIMKVDGVENVIAGTGSDLLIIDETEAAKDNSFTAGLGADRIEYQNVFDVDPLVDKVAQPTVTIQVNTAADQDKVVMTGGRVGTTIATDTLNSVEYITLTAGTATSSHEADVLDVTKMTAGATVNYIDGTVKDLAGVTQLTVEGIAQIENVWADGNDTVIVASSNLMGGMNTREDFTDATPVAKDITFSTFLDFDELNATTNKRVAFTSQTAAQITDTFNLAEYTFNLSKTGSGVDSDTVDYSMAVNSISAVVELDATKPNQYVMVDGDTDYAFDTVSRVQDNDRVDVLVGVEKIVASQGESVLDLTSSTKGLEVKFGQYSAANYQAAFDRDVYNVQISDLSSSVPLTRSYVEYREAGLIANSTAIPAVATATWNRIEGSDFAEKVILNSAHSMDNDTFNLRGGANEVKYNELTKSITLTLGATAFNTATPLTTGLITGTVVFQDGTGAGIPGPIIPGSGTHTITSYSADNGIAAGSLRIAASQDAEDNLILTGTGDKLFLISEIGTVDNQITAKIGSGAATNSIVLTGFELLSDAASNDVYDFGSVVTAGAGLNFVDNIGPDHDTIKVDNGTVGLDGTIVYGGDTVSAAATEISLGALRDYGLLAPSGFDFDVLDVSKITDTTVTTVTGANDLVESNTDEIIFGKINNINSALLFESVVLTQATVAEVGTSFTLNTTTNTLVAGAKSIALTDLANTLSFGGTVLEQTLLGTLRAATDLNATTGVTVTTVGTEAVSLTGGNGNDSLTGSSGNDVLRGGSGNDTLDGSFVAEKLEVHSYTISNPSRIPGQTVIINGVIVQEGVATPGDPSNTIVAGNDADAIGSAFVRVWNANPSAFTVDNLSVAPNTITSVTYDSLTNLLSFTFAAGNDPNNGILGGAGGTAFASVSAETVTQAYAPRVESADTFVFEATAALNGQDTILNFDASDTLNFHQFFANTTLDATFINADLGVAQSFAVGQDVIVKGFNKATLTESDFGVGKLELANNGTGIFITTADINGVADTTNDGYKVYMVTDTDAGVGITYHVDLVGVINTNTELAAGAIITVG